MQKYILLADEDDKALSLQRTAVQYFYGGEVFQASTPQKVKEIIAEEGIPELMVISLNLLTTEGGHLYSYILEAENILFPIIATTIHPLNDFLNYPLVNAWVEKPINADQFTSLVRSFVEVSVSSIPSHVSVDIETLLLLKKTDFDLYLRLSGRNYVKVIHAGSELTIEDAGKLESKGIKELHVMASDSFALLKILEKQLESHEKTPLQNEKIILAIKNLEQVEKVARSLGWSAEVVEQAKRTVHKAMSILGKENNIVDLLHEKLNSKQGPFSDHIGLLTFLVCALSSQLKIPGDNGPMKLTLAALLHDVTVSEECHKNIGEWNERASDLEDRRPETMSYRFHPIEAAKVAQGIDTLPPDIDRIILQHHERLDGTGFPRSLTSSRITYLATIFIITEDLVEFLQKGMSPVTSIKDFLTWGESYYNQGNFQKVFQELKEKIRLQL